MTMVRQRRALTNWTWHDNNLVTTLLFSCMLWTDFLSIQLRLHFFENVIESSYLQDSNTTVFHGEKITIFASSLDELRNLVEGIRSFSWRSLDSHYPCREGKNLELTCEKVLMSEHLKQALRPLFKISNFQFQTCISNSTRTSYLIEN